MRRLHHLLGTALLALGLSLSAQAQTPPADAASAAPAPTAGASASLPSDAALDARAEDLKREVIALMVKGMLNKQAAAELGVAEITVKVHRHNIMQKMKVRSLPDLVRMMEKVNAR